jgi:hypothetical protein
LIKCSLNAHGFKITKCLGAGSFGKVYECDLGRSFYPGSQF